MKPSDELDAFDLATIVRAFAAPAHPDLTEDEAFAIAVRHADQVGAAMKALAGEFATAAGADEKGKSAARPPKAPQKKSTAGYCTNNGAGRALILPPSGDRRRVPINRRCGARRYGRGSMAQRITRSRPTPPDRNSNSLQSSTQCTT